MTRRLKRLRLRGLGLLLACAPLGALPALVAAIFAPKPPPGWVTTISLVLLVLGLPSMLLLALECLGQALRLRRALRAGDVERFEGVLHPWSPLGPELRRLISMGLLRREREVPQSVELLPSARRILAVNGQRVEPWIRASAVELAPVSQDALSAPVPRELLPPKPNPHLDYRRRHMTRSEAAELDRHIRRMRWSGWYRPYATGTVLALMLASERTWLQQHVWYFAIASGITALVWQRYLARVRGSWRLHRDRLEAWILIVRSSSQAAEGAPPANLASFEILPTSRLMWSRQGQPAPWRMIRR